MRSKIISVAIGVVAVVVVALGVVLATRGGGPPNPAAGGGPPAGPSSSEVSTVRPSSSATGRASPGSVVVVPSPPRNVRASAGVTGQACGKAFDLSFDTPVGYPFYQGLKHQAAVTWQDGSGNELTIGGTIFLGTRRAAGSFAIQLLLPCQKDNPAFVSGNGQCSITIDVASKQNLKGSFDCPSIKNSVASISATGTFSAHFGGHIPKSASS